MAEDTGVQIDDVSDSEANEDYTGLTEAVRDLADVMHKGDLERLEVSRGDLHILLCAKTAHQGVATPGNVPVVDPAAIPETAPEQPEAAQPWHQITSPMVGTFYEAPSPGDPPFVRPGDAVDAGQTVAIIEAMKIMNEIVADRPGVIEAILVENGEAVEFGHPLFRMKPA